MFVLNPDSYLLPSYRISPFKTDYVSLNTNLPANNYCFDYFNEKFGVGNWNYTLNGKEAIHLALESYNLEPTDLVTILTTSKNFYISSCVTNEIEKFCIWNREILPETKIIFVNHEFGYPYPEMEKLVATGLPIIEDCCTTFFSQDAKEKVGKYGDFSVYSFPKFFPIQIGGLIVSNKQNTISKSIILNKEQVVYIQNVVSNSLLNENELLDTRKANFDYAVTIFSSIGFTLRFQEVKNVAPSVLLLKNNGIINDLNELKLFLTNHGIQNSIFYGEDAFFIPIHQNLSKTDIDNIYTVIHYYIELHNK